MKPTHKNLLLAVSMTTLLGACEVKKNLDEMHNSTVEMNKTTNDMGKNTDELKTSAGELYDALRQGDSLSARRAALDNLIKTRDPARKLSEAAKYFMSFEFQLWTDAGQDAGDARRKQLGKDAAMEFFKDIQQFIPDMDLTPNPTAGQIISTEKSNMINSLNALSVAMHFLNPKQEKRIAETPGMQSMSMYKIIEESLLAKASIESGEKSLNELPGYVHEVLANEPIAIYLLQARFNYITTIMIGRVTKIANSKIEATRMLATEWELDLSKFNVAQTEEIKMFISGGLKTKALLAKLGLKPQVDPMLKRLLDNMKVVEKAKAASVAKAALDMEITESIKELKNL